MTLTRPSNGQTIDAAHVDQFYDLSNGGREIDVAAIYGGPGNANDATNINLALVAASAAGGGRVFLKSGVWNIGTTLARGVTSDNVELVGAGWSTILRANTNLNDDIINFRQQTGTVMYGVRVAHLFIDGNGTAQSGTAHGIHLQGTYRGCVEHVRCRYVKGIGCYLHQVSGQPSGAYNYIVNSAFTDGVAGSSVGGSVGLKTEGSELNQIIHCEFDWHSDSQGKGLYLFDGNQTVIGGQCDANAYNIWIESENNKLLGVTFDRAYYKEAWLIQSSCRNNHFVGCQFGFFVGSANLSGIISSGATVTSIALQAGLSQAIPNWGVPVILDYGTGNAETFIVTGAGAAAGATSIPVNSRAASFSHSAGALIVPRWRGIDQQNTAGPNYFTDCLWQTNEALPQNITWPYNLGEDSGSSSVSTACQFKSPTGLTIPNQLQAASSVRASVGVSLSGVTTIGVGASPFTYTNNDNVPEAIYIDGGTVSAIAKNALTCFTSTGKTIWLEPSESVTVTWSGAPTMRKDLK